MRELGIQHVNNSSHNNNSTAEDNIDNNAYRNSNEVYQNV